MIFAQTLQNTIIILISLFPNRLQDFQFFSDLPHCLLILDTVNHAFFRPPAIEPLLPCVLPIRLPIGRSHLLSNRVRINLRILIHAVQCNQVSILIRKAQRDVIIPKRNSIHLIIRCIRHILIGTCFSTRELFFDFFDARIPIQTGEG